VDRNKDRSAALAEKLSSELDTRVSCVTADLSDISSVKAAVDILKTKKIDVFIHNAGAYDIPRYKTDEGYDNVFTINFISPYYITKELLPQLREVGGRVVVVGSIAHNYSVYDPSDVDFSTRKRASRVYGNAKRFLTYAMVGHDNVNITHPGITLTIITAHYPKLIFALIKHPMKVIFMSPEKASLSILTGLFSTTTSKNESWIGPRLGGIWGMPCRRPLYTASQEEKDKIRAIADDIFNNLSENGEVK
jgi:NAD(P)-dependent dehydrogenase (short-subunit alcohol dehydrogenase family)